MMIKESIDFAKIEPLNNLSLQSSVPWRVRIVIKHVKRFDFLSQLFIRDFWKNIIYICVLPYRKEELFVETQKLEIRKFDSRPRETRQPKNFD